MIFVDVALLQQQPALIVPDEYREGAVQRAVAMCGELFGGADRPVALVDQYDVFNRIQHSVSNIAKLVWMALLAR
jgi:hypothetical protein